MPVKEYLKQQEIIPLQNGICGLAINISRFAHLLKRGDLNAMVDHLTLTPN